MSTIERLLYPRWVRRLKQVLGLAGLLLAFLAIPFEFYLVGTVATGQILVDDMVVIVAAMILLLLLSESVESFYDRYLRRKWMQS